MVRDQVLALHGRWNLPVRHMLLHGLPLVCPSYVRDRKRTWSCRPKSYGRVHCLRNHHSGERIYSAEPVPMGLADYAHHCDQYFANLLLDWSLFVIRRIVPVLQIWSRGVRYTHVLGLAIAYRDDLLAAQILHQIFPETVPTIRRGHCSRASTPRQVRLPGSIRCIYPAKGCDGFWNLI